MRRIAEDITKITQVEFESEMLLALREFIRRESINMPELPLVEAMKLFDVAMRESWSLVSELRDRLAKTVAERDQARDQAVSGTLREFGEAAVAAKHWVGLRVYVVDGLNRFPGIVRAVRESGALSVEYVKPWKTSSGETMELLHLGDFMPDLTLNRVEWSRIDGPK